jgi:hypothetical protein
MSQDALCGSTVGGCGRSEGYAEGDDGDYCAYDDYVCGVSEMEQKNGRVGIRPCHKKTSPKDALQPMEANTSGHKFWNEME